MRFGRVVELSIAEIDGSRPAMEVAVSDQTEEVKSRFLPSKDGSHATLNKDESSIVERRMVHKGLFATATILILGGLALGYAPIAILGLLLMIPAFARNRQQPPTSRPVPVSRNEPRVEPARFFATPMPQTAQVPPASSQPAMPMSSFSAPLFPGPILPVLTSTTTTTTLQKGAQDQTKHEEKETLDDLFVILALAAGMRLLSRRRDQGT